MLEKYAKLLLIASAFILYPGAAFSEIAICYRFRYVVDKKNWRNDHEADSYISNGYGCDDSVISV